MKSKRKVVIVMYVLKRKDGWYVCEVTSGGITCSSWFDLERLLCFKYRAPALTLLSFLDGFWMDVFTLERIDPLDPRVRDYDLEDFYF